MARACVEFSRSYPDHMKAIMALEGLEPGSISYTPDDIQNLIFNESTIGTVFQVVEQGVKEKLIRSDIPAALVAHTLWMAVLSFIRFVTFREDLIELLELSSEQIFESHFALVLNGIRS